eukprot:3303005-Prymnesium_polylepis.1
MACGGTRQRETHDDLPEQEARMRPKPALMPKLMPPTRARAGLALSCAAMEGASSSLACSSPFTFRRARCARLRLRFNSTPTALPTSTAP